MTRVVSQVMSWIAPQELLECAARLIRILQVILVDLSNREQGVETITAAGIFAPQELIRLDAGLQNLVVIETPSHFDLQLRNGDNARIGLGGPGSAEIDSSIGFDNALVVTTAAFLGRTSGKRLAHALGSGKLIARPSIAVTGTRVGRQRWKQR